MVVAAGAGDRQSQQTPADDVHAVFPFVGHDLGRVSAVILRPHADEPERHAVWLLGLVHQVGRELQANEPVVRHIVVQSLDHPIAVEIGIRITQRIVVSHDVGLVLGVAGDVQPHPRPMLAEVRGSEQPFDDFPLRIGRFIRDKGFDLLGRGRQADQIERHPPEPNPPIGRRRGREFRVFHPFEHKRIQRPFDPCGVLNRRRIGFSRRLERPELAGLREVDVRLRRDGRLLAGFSRIGRAHFDPLFEVRNDFRIQFAFGGHLEALVIEGLDQQAFVGLAGHDRRPGIPARDEPIAGIQIQVPLEFALRLRGMARGTLFDQHRADAFLEKVDSRIVRRPRGQVKTQNQHEQRNGKRLTHRGRQEQEGGFKAGSFFIYPTIPNP